jgi:hypothetical protein
MLGTANRLPDPPRRSIVRIPQFGYIVHVAGPGSSVKSVTSIGEWKVSVAHREDLSMSLSQTLEFRQRLDSEVLERQRLERYAFWIAHGLFRAANGR